MFCAATQAQSIPLNTLTLNGSAALTGDSILLTESLVQAGSAFLPTPYTLGANTSFEVFFVYDAKDPIKGSPGDGLAFVAQNTAMGAKYLGLDGAGLGFFTLTATPAIAATFDYYSNAYTGSSANAIAIAQPLGIDLATYYPELPVYQGGGTAGLRYVWVDYSNAQKEMAIYYSGTPSKPAKPIVSTVLAQDLASQFGGQAYFGFTGGTGDADAVQGISYVSVAVINP
jgi:hypothetical protein